MQYSVHQIATITDGLFLNTSPKDSVIEHILFDSRQITFPACSLFIAFAGRQFDGHDFIKNAFAGGVRNFLVSKKVDRAAIQNANFILVQDTLDAFQKIAAHHRSLFSFPIIGITGSNGKTIVKEWLFQLLNDDFHIVRNPKSYNSQTGVPISILQIKEHHNLGIFEAGISQMGEMEKLACIIHPEIGIFTTLGEAHSEGFPDKKTKLREKLRLFKNVRTLIYRCDDELVEDEIVNWKSGTGESTNLISWSTKKQSAHFFINKINKARSNTEIIINNQQTENHLPFTINFTDDASIENAIHCWVLMNHLQYDDKIIAERMARLEPVAMRLELKEGINGCTIINDSYNSDLNSLKIALDFLNQQSKVPTHTLILSDILQSGQPKEKLYKYIAELIIEKNIDKLIGIGDHVQILDNLLPGHFNKSFFKNTELFLENINPGSFNKEAILLKGARLFHFEKIANQLATKIHQTVMEVNLTALLNNLRIYQQHLLPGTKTMVMVKASAYGSGSVEVAKLLEFQHVDYLAVAYADEGVELRKAGIRLPILVLNPEEATFKHLLKYDLEPEIYNFNLLKKYLQFLKSFSGKEKRPIHLKLDTGMHRLGFVEKDIPELLLIIKEHKSIIKIKSILSHLAASENPSHDVFTQQQINLFKIIFKKIATAINYRPLRHILNSSGIIRFSENQMDMVRLGIGLYGIDESGILQHQLQTVNTLKATISQIKNIEKGETIGYGRVGRAIQKMRIATLSIGYADGLLRKAGNGNYQVLIKGKKASIIGNVCMDMTMTDVTHVPDAQEGDEVVIFGKDKKGNELPVQELAKCLDTIPYEIFTSISKRVKRVYVQE